MLHLQYCLVLPTMVSERLAQGTKSCRYTEAICLSPDKSTLCKLYSNRSQAYLKASRYKEALQDAEDAIALGPGWDKAYYRKGAALQCLKQYSKAASAFQCAWQLNNGKFAYFEAHFTY